jgi:hypothetical protein
MKRNYDDPVYKQWRLIVYKRDGFRCQMPKNGKCCGKKGRINAHHIKKWSAASSLRFEPRNGITLCWDCHDSISGKEHLYEALFMEIVRKKYAK